MSDPYGLNDLTVFVMGLIPVILILMIVKLVSKKGRRLGIVYMLLGASIFGLLVLAPCLVSAAGESANPGTTSTWMSMPVTQTFEDCTDSSYSLEEDDVAIETGLVPDSDDELQITITPSELGQMKYELVNSTSHVVVTFYITNNNIIPYLMPLIIIGLIFGVMRAVKQ